MKMRKSRTVRIAAVLAASSLVVAACGDDDEEPGDAATEESAAATDAPAATEAPAEGGDSIRLWLNGGDTPDELVNFAIAEFNKIHPDVEVKFERQQWTGIVEKLTTALSSSGPSMAAALRVLSSRIIALTGPSAEAVTENDR